MLDQVLRMLAVVHGDAVADLQLAHVGRQAHDLGDGAVAQVAREARWPGGAEIVLAHEIGAFGAGADQRAVGLEQGVPRRQRCLQLMLFQRGDPRRDKGNAVAFHSVFSVMHFSC